MANDRTNMVSLLDFGKWMGGETSNILELGDGFVELTEDWAPNVEEKQYVNQKTAANTLNGYAFSMTPERDHLSDEAQESFLLAQMHRLIITDFTKRTGLQTASIKQSKFQSLLLHPPPEVLAERLLCLPSKSAETAMW